MARVLVVAQCADLAKWEQGFRTHGDLFRSMGATKPVTYGTTGENTVAVCMEVSDLAHYRSILSSPATAQAMAVDGILRESVKSFVLDKELAV